MSTGARITTADQEAVRDRLDVTRSALIAGDFLVAKQPHWEHQAVSLTLGAALQSWSRRTRLGRANIAPGVIFSPEDDVAPDGVWISRERHARALRDGKLYMAPELVVEVLSPGAT